MTIYRKSDRTEMDSDGNTADVAAEAGSTDGAADIQSTQSIPPIEDPVLIKMRAAILHILKARKPPIPIRCPTRWRILYCICKGSRQEALPGMPPALPA